MDFPELPDGHLAAGQEYLAQLRRLGLRPEGLLWTFVNADSKFALWLIWSGVDRVGPYDLTKLLFKAYRASALTREIDPFSVHVMSTKEMAADYLIGQLSKHEYKQYQLLGKNNDGSESVVFQWDSSWIYHLNRKARSRVEVAGDWKRFSANVDRLAA